MTEKAYIIVALIVILAAIAYSATLNQQHDETQTSQETQANTANNTTSGGTSQQTTESETSTQGNTTTLNPEATVREVNERIEIAGSWIQVDKVTLTTAGNTTEATITITLPNLCWNAKQGNTTITGSKLQLTVHLEKKGDICAQALKQQLLTYTIPQAANPDILEVTLVYQDPTGQTITKTIQVQLQ